MPSSLHFFSFRLTDCQLGLDRPRKKRSYHTRIVILYPTTKSHEPVNRIDFVDDLVPTATIRDFFFTFLAWCRSERSIVVLREPSHNMPTTADSQIQSLGLIVLPTSRQFNEGRDRAVTRSWLCRQESHGAKLSTRNGFRFKDFSTLHVKFGLFVRMLQLK